MRRKIFNNTAGMIPLFILGGVWPSVFTVISILYIPAVLIGIVAMVKPEIVAPSETKDSHNILRWYLESGKWMALLCIIFEIGWLLHIK